MNQQLYNHQLRLLEKNPEKILLCWETGTGKSLGALALAQQTTDTTLIIVPKALKDKWVRDAGMMKGGIFRVVTKEYFRSEWDSIGKFNSIIVDEAHYFSGPTSQMSKSLLKYIKKHKVQFIRLLTATPYMSTPWNVYTLAKILGHNWNYFKFKNQFFKEAYIAGRYIPVLRTGIEPEIAKLVSKIGDVVRLDECADVPEQVFETEYFGLNEDQKEAIKDIKEQEINPIVRFTKWHQIESGVLIGDEFTQDRFIGTDKIDRILELTDENKKVAIFCRYNIQIDMLRRVLENNQKKVFVIRGDVKNRDEIVQEVEKSEKCVVLINASCSEGYELPSVGVILFASLSFSYKDYKQSIGRFLRINKLKKNVYIHLVTAGSIDEAVYENIMKKQDFHIEIYAKEN